MRVLCGWRRETMWYVIVGIATTLLNIGLFRIMISLGADYRMANAITLVVVKTSAFFGNKYLVFRSKCENKKKTFWELVRYVLARGFTMLMEFLGLIILVEYLSITQMQSKIIITTVVVILNYILGKLFVFKERAL